MADNSKDLFKKYCLDIKDHWLSEVAGELTYRSALENYINHIGKDVKARNEAAVDRKNGSKKKNKPDFLIEKRKTPIGYIETKDLGVSLDDLISSDPTSQFQRYSKAYANLILTDYLEFRRYVRGELRSKTKIGKYTPKKGIVFFPGGQDELKSFFNEFLLEEVPTVTTSVELASRLAHLTRQVKRLVLNELKVEEDSVRLHKLMMAFQQVLLADMNSEKFSDMFAQTLAYGFFAARVHFDGTGEFSRRTASAILPKTNPFLRKLFREFSDESLPENLVGAVDDIVDLLKKTDIQSILREFEQMGRNDAVIHFYESFLAAYNPTLKRTLGVFYTPDPVVDYIVRSLDQILEDRFGRKKGLADDKALILDPALGTGSFLKKIISRIHERCQKGTWDSYVAENLLERIFGFEILMAPYSVAHLNLGLQLQKTGYSFSKDQRLGVFLTNTLEETAKRSEVLFADWISEEANAAASVKRDRPIMIVAGNPPYSGESQNEGEWIEKLMKGFDNIAKKKCANYFECDGKPLKEIQQKWLHDDYVKFIRFAHWRIEQTGHGVVAFITNHGYLDNPTFCGMRQALMQDFDELYIIDLHGNSKRKEICPDGSKDENVFDIQTGVSIALMIRSTTSSKRKPARVFRTDVFGLRDVKYDWLLKHDWRNTDFVEVFPETPSYLFLKQNNKLKKEYESGISVTELFPLCGTGIVTARDSLTIHMNSEKVWKTVKDFSSLSESEAREKFELGKDARDWKVKNAQADISVSGPKRQNIKPILYRPFDTRFTYYTGKGKGFIGQPCSKVMNHMLNGSNIGLCFVRPMSPRYEFSVHVAESMIDQCAVGNKSAGAGITYLAPLWEIDKKNKKPNLAPEVWDSLKDSIDPDEFFAYVYALLNCPEYKSKYSEFLRTDYPRIFITDDKKILRGLSKLGSELINIHLLKDDRLEGGKVVFAKSGSNEVGQISFEPESCKLYINRDQFFDNISPAAWSHQVGGYNVLEKWLKDRRGTKLDHDSIMCFEKIITGIELSVAIVAKINKFVLDAGGLPFRGKAAAKKEDL